MSDFNYLKKIKEIYFKFQFVIIFPNPLGIGNYKNFIYHPWDESGSALFPKGLINDFVL